MWKRFIACVLIGIGLMSMSSVGHASTGNNRYRVTNPGRTAYSTENKVAFINGQAPAKTSITIKVFGTTDLTRKNFNLNNLPSNSDYIEIFRETITAGNMGFFQKQLDLVSGVNKIVITFHRQGVKPHEIVVYVYDKAPSLSEILGGV